MARESATYAERLAAARKARGLTLDQLAAALGTSRGQVIRWEKSEGPARAWAQKIGRYFNDAALAEPPSRRSRRNLVESRLQALEDLVPLLARAEEVEISLRAIRAEIRRLARQQASQGNQRG